MKYDAVGPRGRTPQDSGTNMTIKLNSHLSLRGLALNLKKTIPLLRRGRLICKEGVREEVREHWAKSTSRITVYCNRTYETARGLAVCFEEIGFASYRPPLRNDVYTFSSFDFFALAFDGEEWEAPKVCFSGDRGGDTLADVSVTRAASAGRASLALSCAYKAPFASTRAEDLCIKWSMDDTKMKVLRRTH